MPIHQYCKTLLARLTRACCIDIAHTHSSESHTDDVQSVAVKWFQPDVQDDDRPRQHERPERLRRRTLTQPLFYAETVNVHTL